MGQWMVGKAMVWGGNGRANMVVKVLCCCLCPKMPSRKHMLNISINFGNGRSEEKSSSSSEFCSELSEVVERVYVC